MEDERKEEEEVTKQKSESGATKLKSLIKKKTMSLDDDVDLEAAAKKHVEHRAELDKIKSERERGLNENAKMGFKSKKINYKYGKGFCDI